MKLRGVLVVCLLAFGLFAAAEARRKTGGGSRKSSTNSRRPTSSDSSHSGLASLSYPGYNSAPAKKQPSPPKQDSIGWSVPKKESPQSHSYPSNGGLSGSQSKPASSGSQNQAAGSHAYPASSGGLSGSQNQPAGSHSYPASSGGLSGSQNQAAGSHAYPASSGSQSAGSQQHAYPANTGASGANQQHAYPPSSGLSGTNKAGASQAQPVNNPPPYSQSNPNYHGNNPPAYSPNQQYGGYNQPHGGYNQPHGGYGGPPPPYGQPNYGGYGGGFGGGFPGYGNMGGFGGFGGMGGYGYQKKSSFFSGNTFGAILAGLAVWNLARSGGKTTNNYYYNNNTPTNEGGNNNNRNEPELPIDPILEHLSNCTLTITSGENSDVTLIPCVIVSSFASNAETVKNLKKAAEENKDGLNCLLTMIFKNDTEMKVKMPCAELSKNAPKNMTEANGEAQPLQQNQNCTPPVLTEELQPGDPNNCRVAPGPNPVGITLDVIPLSSTTVEASTTTTMMPTSSTSVETTTNSDDTTVINTTSAAA